MDQASRVNLAQKVIVDLLTLRETQRNTARALASLAAANQIPTPPPAYQDLYNSVPNRIDQQAQVEMNHPQAHLFDPHHRPSAVAEGYSSYDDADETPPPSISINITSSLSIIGSNNVVGMDTGCTVATIASALVDAIKDTSMSAMGIPMIDEEGKPRTIGVIVDAGMKIDGSDNIIGKDVAKMRLEVLRKKAGLDRKKEKRDSDSESESSQEVSVTDDSGSGSGSESESKAGDGETEEDQQDENEDGSEEVSSEGQEGESNEAEDSATVVESIEHAESSGDDLSSVTRKRGIETVEGLNIMMGTNNKRPRFE